MGKKKPRPIGFLVVDYCEDWEQPLRLRRDDKDPSAGVLDWGDSATLFPSRASARAAIRRTEHWRKAFSAKEGGQGMAPDRASCKLVPVFLDAEAPDAM